MIYKMSDSLCKLLFPAWIFESVLPRINIFRKERERKKQSFFLVKTRKSYSCLAEVDESKIIIFEHIIFG